MARHGQRRSAVSLGMWLLLAPVACRLRTAAAAAGRNRRVRDAVARRVRTASSISRAARRRRLRPAGRGGPCQRRSARAGRRRRGPRRLRVDRRRAARGVHRVPLVSSATLVGATSAGRPLPLVAEGQAHAALISGPGPFSASLEWGTPLAFGPAGHRSCSRSRRRARRARPSILPGEQADVACPPARHASILRRRPHLVEATLDPGSATEVWWSLRDSAPVAAAREVRTTADVLTQVTIGDSDVRMVALVDVAVVQGEPRTIDVRLPAGLRGAGDLRELDQTSEPRPGGVLLTIGDLAARRHQFLLSLERPHARSRSARDRVCQPSGHPARARRDCHRRRRHARARRDRTAGMHRSTSGNCTGRCTRSHGCHPVGLSLSRSATVTPGLPCPSTFPGRGRAGGGGRPRGRDDAGHHGKPRAHRDGPWSPEPGAAVPEGFAPGGRHHLLGRSCRPEREAGASAPTHRFRCCGPASCLAAPTRCRSCTCTQGRPLGEKARCRWRCHGWISRSVSSRGSVRARTLQPPPDRGQCIDAMEFLSTSGWRCGQTPCVPE